jgi:hypothetical protein
MSKSIVNTFSIPAELKSLRCWCGWRAEPSASGKLTKKPFKPTGGPFRISKAEQDLDSFEHVMIAYDRDVLDGINFLPGDGIAGLDLDNCGNEDGTLDPRVEPLLEAMQSYAEYSPSGLGVRVLFRIEGELRDIADAAAGFECFANGKHTLSITGDANLGMPRTLATVSADKVRDLYRNWKADSPNGDLATSTGPKTPTKGPAVAFTDAAEYPPDSAEDVIALVDHCLPLLSDKRAEDYDAWLKVGFALRSAENASGEDFTDRWQGFSRRSAKYDAEESLAKWEGLDPNSISYRSLLHWAKEDSGKSTEEIQGRSRLNPFAHIRPKTLAEMSAASEPLAWRWQGYLAEGYVTLLIGMWKAGKSTLLGHLLREMVTGGQLAYSVRKGRALVLSEERESMWAIRGSSLGIDPEHHRFICNPLHRRFKKDEWPQWIAHIKDLCGEFECDTLVIDTISDYWPVLDENRSEEQADALKPLNVFRDLGLATLVYHHPRKGESVRGQNARGSGYIQGWSDINLEFKVVGGTKRKIESASRFDETPLKQLVELVEGRYQVAADEGQPSPTRDLILAALGEQCLDANDLFQQLAVECRPTTVNALRKLLNGYHANGVLQRSERGGKKDPYKYAAATNQTFT